jgi:hypothetical protein
MDIINKVCKIYLHSHISEYQRTRFEWTYGKIKSFELKKGEEFISGEIPYYYKIEPIHYIPENIDIVRFLDIKYCFIDKEITLYWRKKKE